MSTNTDRRFEMEALASLSEQGQDLERSVPGILVSQARARAKTLRALRNAIAERDRVSQQIELYIDDLKRTLKSRDFAERQADDASKARARFITNISNEFRTPITTILGLGRVWEQKPDLPHAQSLMPQISAAAEQLLQMVDDLLALTAGQNDAPKSYQPCDLHNLVSRVTGQFESAARRKGIQLAVSCPPGRIASIETDPETLQRTLTLLIGNAVKFTDRGRVDVEIRPANNNQTPWQVHVRDTGCGIDAERLLRVFEPMGQADQLEPASNGGLGIGLPLAKRLVQQLNGDLEIRSDLGQGTQMVVSLPAQSTPTETVQKTGSDANVIWLQPQLERVTRDLHSMMHERDHVHGEIREVRLEGLLRLAHAAELKDGDTGTHIMRMGHFSALIAEAAGEKREFCDRLLYASRMHDVGKIAIPDSILKKAGPLTPEEWEIMRSHPEIGASLLQSHSDPLYQLSAEVALAHHEKWDGSGYPYQLVGEAIPLSGRIVALADYFDALTMDRCYRKAFTDDVAMKMVEDSTGSHFDPEVVAAFRRALPRIIEARDQINQGRVRA